ncbi:hypothetical protein Tco_1529866, partial [Tanacetum coccineum]
IVTQVTANVNNANGENRNGGNNGCSYKTFTACNPKEFDGKGGAVALTRWIEKMESVFENSGCTTNQRVSMSWNNFKALLIEEFYPSKEIEKLENEFLNHTMMEESSKQGSTWKDNKKSNTGSGFVATVPPRNDNVRNPLALKGNKNTRNNGNQARGKAFNGNAVEAL